MNKAYKFYLRDDVQGWMGMVCLLCLITFTGAWPMAIAIVWFVVKFIAAGFVVLTGIFIYTRLFR